LASTGAWFSPTQVHDENIQRQKGVVRNVLLLLGGLACVFALAGCCEHLQEQGIFLSLYLEVGQEEEEEKRLTSIVCFVLLLDCLLVCWPAGLRCYNDDGARCRSTHRWYPNARWVAGAKEPGLRNPCP
jgi:hypothetical protein